MNGIVANALVDAENACLSAVRYVGAEVHYTPERERDAKRRVCEAFDTLRAALKGQWGRDYEGRAHTTHEHGETTPCR